LRIVAERRVDFPQSRGRRRTHFGKQRCQMLHPRGFTLGIALCMGMAKHVHVERPARARAGRFEHAARLRGTARANAQGA